MQNTTSGALAPVTPDDHAGAAWIISVTCVFICMLAFGIRVWSRKGSLAVDDLVCGLATVFAIAQTAALMVGLTRGLAKASDVTDPREKSLSAQAFLASEALFVTVLSTSKCASALICRRILVQNMRKERLACWSVLVISILWALGAICGLAINCIPPLSSTSDPSSSKCSQQVLRWEIIAVFDGIIELLLVVIPARCVWPLQMSTEKKLVVICVFGCRLLCPVLAALHVVAIAKYMRSDDLGLDILRPIIWQQVYLCWSVLCPTVPALNRFLKDFHTDMGLRVGHLTMNSSAPSGNVSTSTYKMRTMPKGSVLDSTQADSTETSGNERYHTGYSAKVIHGTKSRKDRPTSMESRHPIIRKETIYSVAYEEGNSAATSASGYREINSEGDGRFQSTTPGRW